MDYKCIGKKSRLTIAIHFVKEILLNNFSGKVANYSDIQMRKSRIALVGCTDFNREKDPLMHRINPLTPRRTQVSRFIEISILF